MNRTQRNIIKLMLVVFLVGYLGSLYLSDRAKEIPTEKIAAAMRDTSVTSLQERDRNDLSRYFSVNDRSIQGFVYYKDPSPMSVNEALILVAHSDSQAQELLEAAQAHLESQKAVFGAYGTDQMALLEDAAVAARGRYVWYFCGPESADWLSAFLSLI